MVWYRDDPHDVVYLCLPTRSDVLLGVKPSGRRPEPGQDKLLPQGGDRSRLVDYL